MLSEQKHCQQLQYQLILIRQLQYQLVLMHTIFFRLLLDFFFPASKCPCRLTFVFMHH